MSRLQYEVGESRRPKRSKRQAYRERLDDFLGQLDGYAKELQSTADIADANDMEALQACGRLLRYVTFRLLSLQEDK